MGPALSHRDGNGATNGDSSILEASMDQASAMGARLACMHACRERERLALCEQVCVPLPAWAIRAGARETIFFNPAEVNVAIVTCGGLCPGLNDVVQGLVRKLEDYGVPDGNIMGIRHVAVCCLFPFLSWE